ncbi:hypothetical protein ASF48_05130 [Rathayibacter sp. Leaf299]|uniref:helix-turn-helix domain-containing protein n=1 Tax=Rathayibacter sp. Leaf299 TaxID=1736328 RepID=UPI0006FB168D|nr:helix-turn-helix transcriptional regulator [Rathayibacter sp. Leaf299]KQQ22569.1 hypothetical protein ASF48_05130 [Rathayibacter sp. Leaf299]
MSIATSTHNDRLAFTLGDRLAKAMRIAGTTREQMATALDVSPNTIGNYTSDRTKPSKLQVKEWAVKTGVPVQWLLTGDASENDGGPDDGGVTEPMRREIRS